MSIGTKTQEHVSKLGRDGKEAVRSATTSTLAETVMRLGYIVRGLLYAVIGLLAFQVALGVGGTIDDKQGAIAALGNTPLGVILIYVVLVGLVGYGLWGLVRALLDPLHKGTDAKGIAQRLGYAASGVSYLLLAISTYSLTSGSSSASQSGGQTTQTQQTTASILSQSWGAWVVGLAGLIVIGIGVLQIVQGVRNNFEDQFQPYSLSSDQQKWLNRMGRFGTIARGVVFGLIGFFLVTAAYTHDSNKAQGIDGVLTSLLHQPFGPWLLGIVALGLLAFGVYSGMSGFWLHFKR